MDSNNALTPAQQRAWDEFEIARMAHRETARPHAPESASSLRAEELSWARVGATAHTPIPDMGVVLTWPTPPVRAQVLFTARPKRSLKARALSLLADVRAQLPHGSARSW